MLKMIGLKSGKNKRKPMFAWLFKKTNTNQF